MRGFALEGWADQPVYWPGVLLALVSILVLAVTALNRLAAQVAHDAEVRTGADVSAAVDRVYRLLRRRRLWHAILGLGRLWDATRALRGGLRLLRVVRVASAALLAIGLACLEPSWADLAVRFAICLLAFFGGPVTEHVRADTYPVEGGLGGRSPGVRND